jgi:hypothetical protein
VTARLLNVSLALTAATLASSRLMPRQRCRANGYIRTKIPKRRHVRATQAEVAEFQAFGEDQAQCLP